MAYNYEYPYTDPNRHNADWLLNNMKELEGRLDGIVEEAVEHTKKYVDECLSTYQAQIAIIRQEHTNLSNRTSELSANVKAEIIRLENKIADTERQTEALFIVANNRTDLMIERNNEYIIKEIEDNILSNIAVINYFTGARVTVQDMFDYLASMHLQNSITYALLADKNLTFEELIRKSITYTELVKNGASLL